MAKPVRILEGGKIYVKKDLTKSNTKKMSKKQLAERVAQLEQEKIDQDERDRRHDEALEREESMTDAEKQRRWERSRSSRRCGLAYISFGR